MSLLDDPSYRLRTLNAELDHALQTQQDSFATWLQSEIVRVEQQVAQQQLAMQSQLASPSYMGQGIGIAPNPQQTLTGPLLGQILPGKIFHMGNNASPSVFDYVAEPVRADYRFDPRDDISAYDLARIVKACADTVSPSFYNRLDDDLKRHFQPAVEEDLSELSDEEFYGEDPSVSSLWVTMPGYRTLPYAPLSTNTPPNGTVSSVQSVGP